MLPVDTSCVMPVAIRPPLIMERGKGSWLYDSSGRAYLDLIQGWAVNCLGHSPDVLIEALTAQAQTLINPSPAFFNAPAAELSALLSKATGLDHVFFTNCGAEANEGAIKLARKWGQLHRGGAYGMVTLSGSFHGRTLATMSASGKPQFATLFEPKVPGFTKVPPNDLPALRAALSDQTAAVMLEPIQGEAGVVPMTLEYLRGVRELTRRAGVLMICDEIQTGVGRTGTFLASESAGIQPDIVTLGKGLGGGVPLAAILAKREVSCFQPGDQGGTFNGNPLVCAAGLAVIRTVLAPGFLSQVRERGSQLRSGLRQLTSRFGLGECRGEGLLLALDLGRPLGAEVVEKARAQGLLINSPQPSLLRFMPALTITEAEIAQALKLLEQVLPRS